MSGVTPIRNRQTDHLLTPENVVITFIDYQPDQYIGVHSIDHDVLLNNVVVLGQIAREY